MLKLIPAIAVFVYCIYSFCREVRLDRLRYLEQDRLGDEHILREIEKFMKQKSVQESVSRNQQLSNGINKKA
jgi:hypothetical protein